MSILIKNMEMPKDCPYCPLAHWNFKNEFTGCEIVKKYFSTEEMYADGKPDFCPLVPVPPHGRLIDVNALYVTAIDITDLPVGECLMVYLKEDIDNAPTIIESTIGQLNSDSAVNEAEEGE